MRVYPNRFARRSAAGGCDEITENHLRTRCKHQLIQRLNEPDDRSLGRTSSRHVQVTYKSHRERHTHEYTTRHGHGSHTIRRRRCTEYSTNCYCEKRRGEGMAAARGRALPGRGERCFVAAGRTHQVGPQFLSGSLFGKTTWGIGTVGDTGRVSSLSPQAHLGSEKAGFFVSAQMDPKAGPQPSNTPPTPREVLGPRNFSRNSHLSWGENNRKWSARDQQ